MFMIITVEFDKNCKKLPNFKLTFNSLLIN